jgi:hypothetical protein
MYKPKWNFQLLSYSRQKEQKQRATIPTVLTDQFPYSIAMEDHYLKECSRWIDLYLQHNFRYLL